MPGHIGKVVQIIGPVIDIKFDSDSLPNIHNSIEICIDDRVVVAEVEQHIGDDIIRAVAMESTEGLRRGLEAIDTGNPITVPVGNVVLGRLFNVLGKPMDEMGEVKADTSMPIHRSAPTFEEQAVEPEVF